MGLQVILRRKTTSSVKDFAKNKLHTPQRAQETTLTSFALNQDNKKELNFLTRPDLAFGFVNKRSGDEINFDPVSWRLCLNL